MEAKEKLVSGTHHGANQTNSDYTEIAAAGGRPGGKNTFLIVLSQSLGLICSLQFHVVKLITSQTILKKSREDIILARNLSCPVKETTGGIF